MTVRPPVWYSLIAVVVSTIVLSAAGVLYTGHVQRESNRQWCELLTVLDDAYSARRPTTPLGQQVATTVHELRVDFGCPARTT